MAPCVCVRETKTERGRGAEEGGDQFAIASETIVLSLLFVFLQAEAAWRPSGFDHYVKLSAASERTTDQGRGHGLT